MENGSNDTSSLFMQQIYLANGEWLLSSIPLVLLIAILTLYGSVGNVLILIIYGRKRIKQPSDLLIMHLAVADLLVCLFSNPFYISINVNKYWFVDGIACKAMQMICYLAISASVALHTSISVDRYFSIRKLGPKNTAYKVAFGGCIFAWCLGVSSMCAAGYLYGRESMTLTRYHVTGIMCGFDDPRKKGSGPTLLSVSLLLVFVVCFVTTSICYGIVGKVAYQQRKMKMQMQGNARVPSNSVRPASNSLEGAGTASSEVGTGEPRSLAGERETSRVVVATSTVTKTTETRSRTTKMLFAITMSFVISWIPFWVVMINNTLSKAVESNKPTGLLVFEEFLKRLYLLNSANNPIIFSFVSITFREEATMWLKKIWCCRWR